MIVASAVRRLEISVAMIINREKSMRNKSMRCQKHRQGCTKYLNVSLLVAFMSLLSISARAAEPPADKQPATSGSCINLAEASAISLPADRVTWAEQNVVINAGTDQDGETVTINTAFLEGGPTSDGVRVILAKYPPGVSSPPHMHPQGERVYVISGSIHGVIGKGADKIEKVYPAGSYLSFPAYTAHHTYTTENTEVLIIVGGKYQMLPVK
jgi:quercetin dioxygenase-like cupin family protein